MVLEQLYSSNWIEKKARYAFIMGLSYSIIGITSAMFLFPEDPGLAAIAFTSLLILPSINKLLSIEENEAARERKFRIKRIIKDHKDIFYVYLSLFAGILISVSFFSVMWPSITTSKVFAHQITTMTTGGGLAGSFIPILTFNLKILIFCLLASFIYGSGSIFIITWIASLWGVIFGLVVKNSPLIRGNLTTNFTLIIFVLLEQMILVASSYLITAIAGGIISKAVLREKPKSKIFKQIIKDGLIIFAIATGILIIASYIQSAISGFLVL